VTASETFYETIKFKIKIMMVQKSIDFDKEKGNCSRALPKGMKLALKNI